ncbi:SurA N-terminal domain-containing protein [Alphaproteobacteria bacterium]|nr:SurA N-terminal domain-containing protein [Alphaproteobacteria bacterium]
MLRSLRNQTQSIFFKAFLFLLIIGFALWGVGDLTGGLNQKPILSVDSKEVTSEEIINELNRLRYTLPQRPSLQEAINNGMLKTVLDKYEQEILINAEASVLNLSVPLKITTTTIGNEKAFKDPLGKFSQTRFLKSLNSAGLSESKYIDSIHTESNYKQLSMPFSNNSLYSNKLIKKLINWQNETRDIDYVFFKNINKESIKQPQKSILREYYNNNKKLYEIPITRDVKYIEINPSIFNNQVKINDKDVKEIYESDKSKYITEEKRKFYQVITQDINKANSFIKNIKTGLDFVTIAKDNFNLTLNDIDIGFVRKSELPSIVVKSLFQAKVKDLIGPIKTKFGYSTYKVISIQPEKIITYKDAYAGIKEELLKELTLDFLYKKIDVIEDLIAEGNNLNEIIKSKSIGSNLSINRINNVSKNGIIYSYNGENRFANKNKVFLDGIWKTPLNQISDIIELPDDKYILVEPIKENKKETPIFEKININIYNDWLKKEIFIQSEIKLKELIKNKRVTFKSLSAIKRNQKSLTKKIKDHLIINKIFEIKDNNLNFFNIKNGIIAIKNVNSKIADYKVNKETVKDINFSLSKSFFNDYSQYYIQILANKHKLKRNYKDLENFIGNIKSN